MSNLYETLFYTRYQNSRTQWVWRKAAELTTMQREPIEFAARALFQKNENRKPKLVYAEVANEQVLTQLHSWLGAILVPSIIFDPKSKAGKPLEAVNRHASEFTQSLPRLVLLANPEDLDQEISPHSVLHLLNVPTWTPDQPVGWSIAGLPPEEHFVSPAEVKRRTGKI